MQIGIYSALPKKEKQVLFELVQECNKADGGNIVIGIDNLAIVPLPVVNASLFLG